MSEDSGLRSEKGGDGVALPPIRKVNLLDKLCFVVAGRGLAGGAEVLKRKLVAYQRFHNGNLVSRPAIEQWFKAGRSGPAREKANKFIKEFLEQDINYDDLTPDRKKVFNQILNFLQSSLEGARNTEFLRSKDEKVGVGESGSLIIRQSIDKSIFESIADSWSGIYTTYRNRLVRSDVNTIAREVVRVYRKGRELRYQHWHLKDGSHPSFFDGSVSVTQETIWFIGASIDNDRMRICHFKRNETLNPVHQRYRWGLMHSDIPSSSSRDPASTRILMVKDDRGGIKLQDYVNDRLKYIEVGELGEVGRFVDNGVSAISIPQRIEPLSDFDEVLRTSQQTLEALYERELFRTGGG